MNTPYRCPVCGKIISNPKPGQVYCSEECKIKARYERRKVTRKESKFNGLEEDEEIQLEEKIKPKTMDNGQMDFYKGKFDDLKEAYTDFKNEAKNQITELKGVITRLAEKNERLTEENTKLRIDNEIKDRKHELALTEANVNSKATLGGIVKDALDKDNLASIAEIIRSIKGLKDDGNNQGNEQIQGVTTGDPNKDAMLNNMIQVLAGKDSDFVAKFYGVLSASLNSNLLDTVIGMINKAHEQNKVK